MKKVIAFVMAIAMMFSLAVTVSAESTTTITTFVPAATYTLNIPADQEITYGTTSKTIGNVTITDSANFADGKNVRVKIEYDAFTSNEVSTKIPYEIYASATGRTSGGSYGSGGSTSIVVDKPSGSSFIFEGSANGTCNEFFNIEKSGYGTDTSTICLNIRIASSDWGKALGGNYSTTLTFTSEIYVEE